jgi:hypothetical protein
MNREMQAAMGVSGGRNLWILAERYRLFGRGRWWVMIKDEKSTYVATFGLYTYIPGSVPNLAVDSNAVEVSTTAAKISTAVELHLLTY